MILRHKCLYVYKLKHALTSVLFFQHFYFIYLAIFYFYYTIFFSVFHFFAQNMTADMTLSAVSELNKMSAQPEALFNSQKADITEKSTSMKCFSMAPPVGLEPTTTRLTAARSTN